MYNQEFEPDRDILGNVIRRSRVGEKCCGFVLVVEGASVTHRPSRACHWTKGTSETCMKVAHLVVFLPPALAPTSFLNTIPRCLPLQLG